MHELKKKVQQVIASIYVRTYTCLAGKEGIAYRYRSFTFSMFVYIISININISIGMSLLQGSSFYVTKRQSIWIWHLDPKFWPNRSCFTWNKKRIYIHYTVTCSWQIVLLHKDFLHMVIPFFLKLFHPPKGDLGRLNFLFSFSENYLSAL